MRTKLVVGNWKMNFTAAQAGAATGVFLKHMEARPDVDVVICPPYLAIATVRSLTQDTHVKVGAQDVFWEDHGAFTGKVSARMLAEAGVSFCIVGHSETRGRFGSTEMTPSQLAYFGESDETVNLKIKALLYHSINPILCVGETAEERAAGRTDEVISTQLHGALQGIDPSELYLFSVAYEPVWAIGTGNHCDPEEANRVCGLVRSELATLADGELASIIRVLYGGSIRSLNSGDFFKQSDIDGGLVGGASLDPLEFSRIVMSA